MGGSAVDDGGKKRIIAVCGVKNSGKTTLLVRMIEKFSAEGVRTAVIKHDGHDFSCDIPGTDSFRLKEAGAYGTAVFSASRTFVHRTEFQTESRAQKEARVKELAALFPDAEIIFVEGMKDSPYPKIEVIRDAISREPASNPEGRFLIVTDRNKDDYGEETASFDEIEKIVRIVRETAGISQKGEDR